MAAQVEVVEDLEVVAAAVFPYHQLLS